MLLNCHVQKTLESPLESKEIQPVQPQGNHIHWEDWCWSWNSNTLATWCEGLTHWKRPWFWERLKAGGEGDNRGWDGWMASPTQWTWVWVNSWSWCWTGRPGMLQSMGSQRVRHNWTTELNWCLIKRCICMNAHVCTYINTHMQTHILQITMKVYRYECYESSEVDRSIAE